MLNFSPSFSKAKEIYSNIKMQSLPVPTVWCFGKTRWQPKLIILRVWGYSSVGYHCIACTESNSQHPKQANALMLAPYFSLLLCLTLSLSFPLCLFLHPSILLCVCDEDVWIQVCTHHSTYVEVRGQLWLPVLAFLLVWCRLSWLFASAYARFAGPTSSWESPVSTSLQLH